MVSSGFTAQTRASGILKEKTGRRSLQQQEDCSKKLIAMSAPRRCLRFGKQRGRWSQWTTSTGGPAAVLPLQSGAEVLRWLEVTQGAQSSVALEQKA